MSEEIEKCRYVNLKRNVCVLLADTQCTGTRAPELCKFHKTDKEYIASRDRAILINREKGNCQKCKYQKLACMTSEEANVQSTARKEEKVENS